MLLSHPWQLGPLHPTFKSAKRVCSILCLFSSEGHLILKNCCFFLCFSWLLASVASVAFGFRGFRGFCSFWLFGLSIYLSISICLYLSFFLSFGQLFSFLFLHLLFLLFTLQRRNQTRKQASKQARAAHLWIWCAAGGGRCATKSALHPQHPRLPRNQYFKVNSPAQNFLTKQNCFLHLSVCLSIYLSIFLSIYLSIHLSFYLSICSSTSTKYYTCHEICTSRSTKSRACHEICTPRPTKSCTCHQLYTSTLRSTKSCACHEICTPRPTKHCTCHETRKKIQEKKLKKTKLSRGPFSSRSCSVDLTWLV